MLTGRWVDKKMGDVIYLFLTGLPHGKLVNMRPERVQHEFTNAPVCREDRAEFAVLDAGWKDVGGLCLAERIVAMLRDWGTGLDVGLYEEAASHLCGRAAEPESEIEIRCERRALGIQPMRLAYPESALRVTCLPPERHVNFEAHLHQFLRHAALQSVHWINITRSQVQFKTIS